MRYRVLSENLRTVAQGDQIFEVMDGYIELPDGWAERFGLSEMLVPVEEEDGLYDAERGQISTRKPRKYR